MSDPLSDEYVVGVGDAPYWANRVVKDINSSRACGIAIANDTKFHLVEAQYRTSSGKVLSLCPEIPSGRTGFAAAVKTSYSLRGTVGVLTYRIDNFPAPCQMQLMWHVPFDYSLYDNFLNVDFGVEGASDKLLSEMYSGSQGTYRLARHTPHTFYMSCEYLNCPRINVMAVMGDNGRSALAVTLKLSDMWG